MKSKAKTILEYIPFLGDYVNNRVFSYRVEHNINGIAIDHTELHEIINGVFPGVKNLRKLDKQSQSINPSDVLKLLINTNMLRDQYVVDAHDCDDYAFAMKGFFSQKALSNITFGIMLSRTHAYNFFVDDQKQLWIMEPQSAAIFLAKDHQTQTNEDYNTIEYIV